MKQGPTEEILLRKGQAMILPFLRIKKKRAMLLQRFIEIRRPSKTYSKEGLRIYQRMKLLNKRGIK